MGILITFLITNNRNVNAKSAKKRKKAFKIARDVVYEMLIDASYTVLRTL